MTEELTRAGSVPGTPSTRGSVRGSTRGSVRGSVKGSDLDWSSLVRSNRQHRARGGLRHAGGLKGYGDGNLSKMAGWGRSVWNRVARRLDHRQRAGQTLLDWYRSRSGCDGLVDRGCGCGRARDHGEPRSGGKLLTATTARTSSASTSERIRTVTDHTTTALHGRPQRDPACHDCRHGTPTTDNRCGGGLPVRHDSDERNLGA